MRALLVFTAQWCLLTAVAFNGGAALYAGELPRTRYICACAVCTGVHARARALCTCVLSEASLRDDVIEWQSIDGTP